MKRIEMGDEGMMAEPDRESNSPNPPVDLSHHFSRVTRAREASSIKGFYKYFQIPGIGNLAGGLPNPAYFPYDTLEAQSALPERWKPMSYLDGNQRTTEPNSNNRNKRTIEQSSSTSRLLVPHESTQSSPLRKIDLVTALQYGTAEGYPPLYTFLRQFTLQNLHPDIPYKGGAEIVLTSGSTDGFAKTIETFTNVWSEETDRIEDREGMLCEEFAYMNALQAVRPRGVQIVPVNIDEMGMVPHGQGGLEDVLQNWDVSRGKRPHLMYTVTIGQNPTSGTLSIERRSKLYALCCTYDVLIIEDDPYWYLQYPSAAALEAHSRGEPLRAPEDVKISRKPSGFAFLDSLVPSYLSIDKDGRVIRLDTFSKTIAPGCRVGWVTAQPAIIERIVRITETTTQQPSGFVQSMVAELIMGPQPKANSSGSRDATFTGWQVSGWVRWLEGLRGNYERHMQIMCSILEEGRFLLKQSTSIQDSDKDWAVISKNEMYTFSWPRGGMFIWIEILYTSHPLFTYVPHERLATALWIFFTTEPYLVLVAPGTLFGPSEEVKKEKGWRFLRMCFAAVREDEVGSCSRRFVEGVEAFWKIKDPEEIDRLLGEEPPAIEQTVRTLIGAGACMGC